MVTVALTPALIAALSGSALAADGEVTDVAVRDDVTDRATDEVIDLPTDVVTDRPTDVLTDRPTDVVTDRPTDTPNDRCRQKLIDRRCVSDRPTDRPVDRCLLTADHPRPCIDDHRPHDLNYRKLIWRLIHAHEWEKLVRLLHALGLL